jgi:hypothetical protein
MQDDSQIPEAFGDALGGLLSVVASNVRITVTPIAAESSSSGAAGCSVTKVQHGGSQEAAGGAAGVSSMLLHSSQEQGILLRSDRLAMYAVPYVLHMISTSSCYPLQPYHNRHRPCAEPRRKKVGGWRCI